ncbi:MAG TPA: carbohydrate ABC transporter permease [Devosia sp.]|jgi:raffinose/stachyose/melibiose transport system permease protein|nr:carbohydrate ABC transporter permease [Devosia sp.]
MSSSRTPGAAGGRIAKHLVLIAFTVLAAAPVLLIFLNSFKARRSIFANPYALPDPTSFSLVGYDTVFARSNFALYYGNSLTVSLVSLVLILGLGSMIAFALAEYPFTGNKPLAVFFIIGIMIPIRLGSVSLLQLVVSLHLVNTLLALIFVYVAQGLPLAVFILTQFMRQVPRDLKDAARVDGANEYRIYLLVLPLVRPALATVAVLSIIPIWNDLWFPLILAPGEATKTVTMGAMQFLGQFSNDWNAVLSALSLSAGPILALYLLFSRQFLRGLTAGAVK